MRYQWAGRGDVNAFFGLMLDNVAVMVLLVGAVSSPTPIDAATGEVKFTSSFVMTHMVPGTALGVLLGDLVYTWMAFRLARRTGRKDVTAMPLGLDTPSTFGVAFLVLLPALHDGYEIFQHDHARAMAFSWHVGLVVLALSGVFKIVLSPLGNAVRRFCAARRFARPARRHRPRSSLSCRCCSTVSPRRRWSAWRRSQ